MYKLFLAVLGLLLSLNAHAFDQPTLVKVFFSIVQIHTTNADNSGEGLGSGVVIGKNSVLTNCHVLTKAKTVWISQGEDSFGVDGVQANAHQDLCLLTTANIPMKPAVIGSVKDVKIGAEVFAVGHSSGIIAATTSRGQVKSLYPYEGSQVIRTSARFSMGASGSGLFDDEGRLIGINTFKSYGRNAFFYAMPADWIEALKALPVQPIAPFPQTAFWESGDKSPYFLQAAMPETQKKWPELLEISQRWLAAEPNNPDAWYELGIAQAGLGQDDVAKTSFQKAVSYNTRHGDALFQLGLLASKHGDRAEVHKISVALADISTEFAEDFNTAIGCTPDC